MRARGTWGSDGQISLPQPMENSDVEMADFEGFCFTPDGIRINLTSVDRETILADGYAPQGVNHGSG